MNECSIYIPPQNPDKMLTTAPASSVEHSIFLHWMIPTAFITVDPEISFCWVSRNEFPVNLDWVFKYQYLNKESYMGYFDEAGMPHITFDDGRSEEHTITLNSESLAEKDMMQVTRSHPFTKKDRRSGSFVVMEIYPQDLFEMVYFMGAHIKYTEAPRVISPTGRKRTRKRWRHDEEPYPYDDFGV